VRALQVVRPVDISQNPGDTQNVDEQPFPSGRIKAFFR
jgi:hypothetical protein